MATEVNNHPVSAFASPVNGDALNADVVRGNDNAIQVAYTAHDSDPGIHVQSSALASRPAASTAGAGTKWISEDYPQKLYISDGVDWHEVGGDSVNVYCKATQTLAKGDIVKVTGFNTGQDVVEVAKVSSAADVAFGICETAAASGGLLYITNTGIIEDVNTGSFAIGDILYPNTSGGLTTTKPTSGNYQVVAFVLRSNASNGVLYVEFSAPRIVEASTNTASTVVRRDASGDFSAGTVTAALTGNASTATALQTARSINGVSFNGTADITVTAAAGTLSGSTLAAGVTASSLTSVGTLTGLTVSGTSSLNGATVINDAAANADFRVEGVGNANVLFVDASADRVGIGTSTPGDLLTVHGNPMRVGENSTLQYVQIGASASGGYVEQYGTVDLDLSNAAASNVKISTNGGERARVTSVGNFKIGGTANRSTTEGAKQLVLFNGTAPAGTLANGISIYSSSGEAYVMDAAGNATLFSPHDRETNEWIFYSVHTPTGKTLRIDMERIMRFINDQFALNAIHEV